MTGRHAKVCPESCICSAMFDEVEQSLQECLAEVAEARAALAARL